MKPRTSHQAAPKSSVGFEPEVLLEALEPRIAPASLTGIDYKAITLGTPQLVKAGEGLSTSSGSGSYILAVSKGQALVFTTDLNGNNAFDPNEITGVAAGDGLRLTSFVTINGDIVTNLLSNGNLTDSDGDSSNGRDGQILLNSQIEGITLRSVTAGDVGANDSVGNRLILSDYSIHGNVYAGGGVGVSGAGIILDTVGLAAQVQKFSGSQGEYQVSTVVPSLGSIRTGSAAGGQFFSFGFETVGPTAGTLQAGGNLKAFIPGIGQAGGDIIGLKVGDNADSTVTTTSTDGTTTTNYTAKPFTIDAIIAGNGGIGAKGGDVRDVTLMGDTAGLRIVAGDGGKGITGGNGGSIVNLADLGSSNGVVQIRTGNGGEGFLKSAGSAGSLSLGTFLMNGDISVGLGNGGNALGNAGAGTGLLSGTFKPTDSGGLSSAVAVLSTYRENTDIGSPRSIDFNNDGFTDIVFLTNTPDQLGVKFGTTLGISDSTPTLYFAAPSYSALTDASSAVVVGDFDANGFLDIATVSSTPNSTDSLYVFLNPGDGPNSWFNTASKTSGANYIDGSIRCPLPSLKDFGFLRSGAAITDLVAGDFNGDGVTDLSYLAQVFYFDPDKGPQDATTAVMLTGVGDGRFFADFQYDRTLDAPTLSPVLSIVDSFKGHGTFVLKATNADTSSVISPTNPNVLVLAQAGSKDKPGVATYQFLSSSLQQIDAVTPSYSVPKVKDGALDGYDDKEGTPVDLAITDVGADGIFDVVVLNDSNSVTVLGGAADATFSSNDGIALVGELTLLGKDSKVSFKGIQAGVFDSTNPAAQFALYSVGAADDIPKTFEVFALPAISANLDQLEYIDTATMFAPFPSSSQDYNDKIIVFDAYKTSTSDADSGIVNANPTTTKTGFFEGIGPIAQPALFGLNSNSLGLVAGTGGQSFLGAGGAGGSIGSGSVSLKDGSPTSSFQIVLPADRALQPDVDLRGGGAGSGFTSGGAGGSIRGVLVTYAEGASVLTATVSLSGGDGGAGLTATGGAGGDLSGNKITSGNVFAAGAGGFGFRGGAGGSINGSSAAGGFSSYNSDVDIKGGSGGFGMAAGGAGGSISNFATFFPPLVGGVGGSLNYVGGTGGAAVAGIAGSGGSVINSSPVSASDTSGNNLVGPIRIQGGEGANGLTGGAGGSISNFFNNSGIGFPVTIVSVLAGNGGTGITGNGGVGGSVSTFKASGTGIGGVDQFNRVLAGDGGSSFGAQGGKGGSLSTVEVVANASATAIASGQGGDGLLRGGDGGSITASTANSAAGVAAKVIVWAGKGGDAFAALSTASNVGNSGDSAAMVGLRAFGTSNGIGGSGGSIVNFTQPTSTNTSVDLIAGNGGSTVNYGSPANQSTNVGRGGSITGTKLTGEAGRVDSSVAIVSYADDFVQNVLRDAPDTQLTDSLGNVGVVAGVAGRVKSDLPAGDAAAKTGSVTNFTAKSIMSMVAGSVDRIAAINTISGITLTSPGGLLGAYKNTPVAHPESSPLYYSGPDQTGSTISAPQVGGSLMDGAVITQNNTSNLSGARLFVL